MPTPFSTMALLASAMIDISPDDDHAVDDFYSNIFPAFSEPIRDEIFSWLSAIESAPSSGEVDKFVADLRQQAGFEVRRTTVVSGSENGTAAAAV